MVNKRGKASIPVPVPQPPAEIPQRKELVLEGDPEQQLAFAQKAAKALMSWVSQKPKKVMIRGEQYLEFADWQVIGRFYGATVGVDWTKPIVDEQRKLVGYEARAVVYRNGITISAAEASCLRAERNWATRDEFMLKSMAQTRASGKALRQAFGWVAGLAGYRDTPAEEMGDMYDKTKVDDDAEVISVGTDYPDTPKDVTGQRQRIVALLKACGVDVTDAKACKQYVADNTQLELVEANFPQIIHLLETE